MHVSAFEKHCWAEIDLDALLHNFSLIQNNAQAPVCAVVKADAYGHGDVAVARTLQTAGAAAFAVSSLPEGRHLRRHGITRPILVLGYTDPAQAAALAHDDITTAVFSLEYAQALSDAALKAGVTVKVHIKADTGMGRIGFGLRTDFEAALTQIKACYALSGLAVTGIFQHFAVADSLSGSDEHYTEKQYRLFQRLVQRLRDAGLEPGTVHCANSAAQMRHPEWSCDLVRAGIILYGLDPSEELHFPALRQVMTLKARVTQVKDLQAGQSVSYGRTFTTNRPRRVATVCVGYADGYPRALSDGQGNGVMRLHGRHAPVLGRVCMDQTVVDVTDIPQAAMGDEIVVFGPTGSDTADTIAFKTHTINYEVTCGLARRVPRIYLQNGEPADIWNDLEET